MYARESHLNIRSLYACSRSRVRACIHASAEFVKRSSGRRSRSLSSFLFGFFIDPVMLIVLYAFENSGTIICFDMDLSDSLRTILC